MEEALFSRCRSLWGLSSRSGGKVSWLFSYSLKLCLYANKPFITLNLCSTVKCFRVRFADQCGANDELRCALRHRINLDNKAITDSYYSEATFRSPGFFRRRPAYYNRNFCIYNISLTCPEEIVNVEQTVSTGLSDTEDYLSFHTGSKRKPVKVLNMEKLQNSRSFTIPSASFYAVLWSNNDKIDGGKFEIKATCQTADQGSAQDNLLTTTAQ